MLRKGLCGLVPCKGIILLFVFSLPCCLILGRELTEIDCREDSTEREREEIGLLEFLTDDALSSLLGLQFLGPLALFEWEASN